MKLRVSVFVDLVELDTPGYPTTQRISGKIIEHDYSEKNKGVFIEEVKTHAKHVLSYLKTWMEYQNLDGVEEIVMTGIEQVLSRLAHEPSFSADFFTNRTKTLDKCGIVLKPSEVLMLVTASAVQLHVSIKAIKENPEAVSMLTSYSDPRGQSRGIRPDIPPPRSLNKKG